MPILSREKTAAAILEKFSKLSDYEKRKIVFWYDSDGTAGEEDLNSIKIVLEQNGIKMLSLNNNFFMIKKILEHEDTKSNYLMYSSEQERRSEDNWLLDIQLYSGRFENSGISDIKSEIGIEGYDMDSFIEKHKEFFAKTENVVPFKKLYENTWKEVDFLKGIFAVITCSAVPDEKKIVKNILMNSLNETENTIWKDVSNFDLTESFWDIIGRNFGFYTEYPTLKKFFLSLFYHPYRQKGRTLIR